MRLCRNARNLIDVMLSKAKHLAFSGGYESRDSSAEFILSQPKGLRMGIMAKNCCTIEKKNICARGVMHTIVEGFQQWGDWMVKKALSSLWAYTG